HQHRQRRADQQDGYAGSESASHERAVRKDPAPVRQLLRPLSQAVHHDDADHAVHGTNARDVLMSAYMTPEGYDGYRQVDLEARAAAASPYELVLILFDGLLDELARVRDRKSVV